MQKITSFFLFTGLAEQAMSFYASIFPESEIIDIKRYGEEGPGVPGTVMHATFLLDGQQFMCIDSNMDHGFTFTPSLSLYVSCESDEEVERLFRTLSSGGAVLMPLGAYPFSNKYAWVNDKFGVSWQLNLL